MTDELSYATWVEICNKQQWNAQTQIVLLEAFIRNHELLQDFAQFAQRCSEHIRALEN